MVVDESHVTVPQLGAMYKGDRSRKETLVEFGFRPPSAMDNRPLRFEEWERRAPRAIYVAATPAKYELERSDDNVVELVGRPTGLIDPEVEVRPVRTQVDDLLGEIHKRVALGDRVLVTTLTKRMAENLTDYLSEQDVRRATSTPTSTPWSAPRSSATCAWASSTCWWASTCCVKASTCPRSRWSPSSTRTRRASCARPVRSSRRSAVRRATCVARRSSTATRSPVP